MQSFRFVGTETQIGDHKLTKLGQEIKLTDKQVADIFPDHAPHPPLLPASDFDAIGFTGDELSRYAFPGQRIDAAQEFLDKLGKAHGKVGKFARIASAGLGVVKEVIK